MHIVVQKRCGQESTVSTHGGETCESWREALNQKSTYFLTDAGRDDQEGDEKRNETDVDQNVEHIVVGGRDSVVVVVEQRAAVVSKRIEPVQRAHFNFGWSYLHKQVRPNETTSQLVVGL